MVPYCVAGDDAVGWFRSIVPNLSRLGSEFGTIGPPYIHLPPIPPITNRQMSSSTRITRTTINLTHHAVLLILQTCLQKAESLNCPPVHIVIASRSGQILGSLSMDEAYFLSIETARNKALTAASHKTDTRSPPPGYRLVCILLACIHIRALASRRLGVSG